jgi:muramoyltetrapeptide carboxypeptidase
MNITPRSIDLIAPSGYANPEAVQRGISRLAEQGHTLMAPGAGITERHFQRFAGTDSERADDINRLADTSRPVPDIVLAVRGGYGATRLLHGIDYEGLHRRLHGRPVVLVGHSDFTAIQLALFAQARIKTFGGPMLAGDFGAETLDPFTMENFWNAITRPSFTVTSDVSQVQSCDVKGMLWGGNLAMIASLIGTRYMPKIEGGVLFIEDVNEHPFRVERMIYQLHESGILGRQHALVLGEFTGARLFDSDNGYDFDQMLEQVRSIVRIPVITGLKFGHVPELLTLPFGADAHLVARPDGFELRLWNYPHLN